MKKEYIEPSVKAVEIKMNQVLAGSEFDKQDFGGGSGDGGGATVNDIDAEFEDEF